MDHEPAQLRAFDALVLRPEAVECEGPLGHEHALGLGLPTPVAHVGAVQGAPQMLLVLGQGAFGDHAAGHVAEHHADAVEHREHPHVEDAVGIDRRFHDELAGSAGLPDPGVGRFQRRGVGGGRKDIPQPRSDQFGTGPVQVRCIGSVAEEDPPLGVQDIDRVGQALQNDQRQLLGRIRAVGGVGRRALGDRRAGHGISRPQVLFARCNSAS